MKIKAMIVGAVALCVLSLGWAWAGPESKGAPVKLGGKKVLMAYFSHTGNTRALAGMIHKSVGGDVFEIVSAVPYPNDYEEVKDRAQKELESGARPKLKSHLANAAGYDVIFVGYPNWWGTLPTPVMTFLTENAFAGKTVIPFCTNEGSGLGRSVGDLAKLCPRAKILSGLAVRGHSVKEAQGDVSAWLRRIGF